MRRLFLVLSLCSFSVFADDDFAAKFEQFKRDYENTYFLNLQRAKNSFDNVYKQFQGYGITSFMEIVENSISYVYDVNIYLSRFYTWLDSSMADLNYIPSPPADLAPAVDVQLLARFYIYFLIGLGFGFGSIFWAIVLWLIFGKGGR